MSGWPKRRTLAHAFLREYSDKRLKLAQHVDKLGIFLTWPHSQFLALCSLTPPGECSVRRVSELGQGGRAGRPSASASASASAPAS